MRVHYLHYRPIQGHEPIDPRVLPAADENVFRYSQKLGFFEINRERLPIARPSTKGGLTICEIIGENKEEISRGYAYCSFRDAFSYKMGRRISYGRAMHAMKMAAEKGIT